MFIFLLKHNGGRPDPAHFHIKWQGDQPAKHWNIGQVDYFLSIYDGQSCNLLESYTTYKGRIPTDTISIADAPGGNQLLIGIGETTYGKLFFWMHSYERDGDSPFAGDYSNVGYVADSFNEFLNSLYDAE